MRSASVWVILASCAALQAQNSDEDFHVYRDAPRIHLTAQRLRLLQRERERKSVRWQNLEALIEADAPMPEPGFALALDYQIAKDRAAARKAIEWALQHDDLRQVAFVYDWCLSAATPAESEKLQRFLQQGIANSAPDVKAQAARALAAVALADKLPDAGDRELRSIATWFRQQTSFKREDLYPMFELLHAIRDNTKVDLRESARDYFKELPLDYVAGFYPASFPGPDNDFRIPVSTASGEPDLNAAAAARAAGLAMIAFDTNTVNYQYTQGFLMNEHFVMRGAFGSPYEFLWANPYQPGLAYQTLPLIYHDAISGDVFARTAWDEDATWIGYFDGNFQLFREGSLQTLRKGAAVAAIHIGTAIVTKPADPNAVKLRMDTTVLFVLGLAPKTEYSVEIDDQEVDFFETDAGGTLVVNSSEGTDAGVRIRPHTVN